MYNLIYLVVPVVTDIDSPVIDTLSGVAELPEDIVAVVPIAVVPSYTLKISEPELLLMKVEKVILFITRLFPAVGVIGNSR